jgi:hypothetical protein
MIQKGIELPPLWLFMLGAFSVALLPAVLVALVLVSG